LIPDIPSFGKFNHSKKAGADTYHSIQVDENSWLKKVVGVSEGEINSAHHQSAEIVAPDLVANAISKDGVIEGLEWKKQDDKPYMMLVQWHPERMIDQQNIFTQAIRKSFIEAVKS
jgi:putative glutamine amidotransferase